jgi:hypothetical protein
MAHTVVIQLVSRIGDNGIATGTVDGGAPVTVSFWWSAITSLATAAQVQSFLAGLMIAAAIPSTPAIVSTYNGTITH